MPRFRVLKPMLENFARRIANSALAYRIAEVFDRRSENRMTELGMLAQAFEFVKINSIPGDYFEFGIWKGKTFVYANRMKHRYGLERVHMWGFDSFQGLPQVPQERDNIWHMGQFACSEETVRKNLGKSRMMEKEYTLVPGYYHESLTDKLHERLREVKAAIVYIDCDLYESTRQVLPFVTRYLVNGSIVCFDDYHNYASSPYQGEQRALTEFLEQDPGMRFCPYFEYSPLGKSFIVRRNEAPRNGQSNGK